MKMPVLHLFIHGALFVVLTHATAVNAQERVADADVNARPSPSSPSTWQSQALTELDREAALRASGRERQARFSAARSTWEKADKAALRQRPAAAGGAPAEVEVILPAVSQRGIHRAALLSVYDADDNGVLDEAELALLTSDRQTVLSSPAASVAASRWRRLGCRRQPGRDHAVGQTARFAVRREDAVFSVPGWKRPAEHISRLPTFTGRLPPPGVSTRPIAVPGRLSAAR
jgi:hypothetical protein